ncbi:hypothetical protein [Bosea sp. BK604]|uniref:hypothetical protein n=1 Tax=Bosea sp. BK604 TaxID=2512180 RepID=UPI001053A19F|nr:hypothetical protein [Bosea sp. BK604]TCR63646.1 hypothetical protein EV560_108294 [Bosea sp. BK604]
MKHRSAAEFIPSFDISELDIVEITPDAPAPAIAPIELPSFLTKAPPREPAPDLEQIFENGRAAGRVEAQLAAEEQLARLQSEHAAALESARQAWADEVATVLAAQVPQALDDVGERIADTVGRLLRPFLATELRAAASRALIEQITPLLSGTDGALVRVAGPQMLVETLRRVFPPERAVSFEENDAAEVTILVGETMIETRIGAWIARLEGQGPDRRRRPAVVSAGPHDDDA